MIGVAIAAVKLHTFTSPLSSMQLRKPQAHQFIRSTGVARGAGFLPVLQDVTNLDVGVAQDEAALKAPPAADVAPVS